jgi:hypothetical protein
MNIKKIREYNSRQQTEYKEFIEKYKRTKVNVLQYSKGYFVRKTWGNVFCNVGNADGNWAKACIEVLFVKMDINACELRIARSCLFHSVKKYWIFDKPRY